MPDSRKTTRLAALFSTAVLFTGLTACSSEDGGGGEGIPNITLGSGTISFSSPTTREDGSSASGEIAAYRIVFGPESGDYTDELVVDSSSTMVTVDSIPVGTYHAVVTAIDNDGRESVYSDEVVITVQ